MHAMTCQLSQAASYQHSLLHTHNNMPAVVSLCWISFRRASQGHKHLFQGGLGQGVLINAELCSGTLYNFKQGRKVQTLHPAH